MPELYLPDPQAADRQSELQRLSSAHLALVELAVAGYTQKQIAEMTGRSPVGVGLILAAPHFQQEVARRREQVQRANTTAVATTNATAATILMQSQSQAAETMRKLMDAPDNRIKFASAKDILDRTYGKGASQDGIANVTIVNAEVMQVLVQALEEDRNLELGRQRRVEVVSTVQPGNAADAA